MRKNVTKVVAALLSAALVVTSVTVPGSTSKAAAKTLKLTVKSGTTKKKPAKQTLWLNAAAKEKKVTLTAKGVKKVTWKSSKKSVATVKKNVVTAKKAGTAYITAKSGKKQFTVKITVNKAATGVTLGKTGDMKVGATKTVKIGYKGSPNKAGKSVTVKVKGSAVKATVKSATKLEVKALKKGSATVTITSKKSKKTAKITVKVTEKAAATAAPSASAAPASQAPAESAAPTASADASAAPSADVSAAPGESTAPSVEPSREPSVVTEIKILNDVALTNEDGTKAYVYYDVLDQYGESMRTTEDIQWTTSPNTKKVDKTAGKITFETTTADKFTYGKLLYLNGVHVKTGVTKNTSVTVGLEQAVDTIVFGGFVNKNNPTKKVDDKEIDHLPANFAKNTYYMLFQTKDQNGNLLDVTESDEYGAKNVTFISSNPLLMTIDSNNTKTYTIDGVDYAAIAVEPAQYVDKGGEVNVTAIGNKTGGKTPINIRIGETPQLQSLVLSAPKEVVADGDTGVKIPYVAKDTKGNEVTNYETIVRSSNSLQLSASDGTTLTLKEENDGTAGIYWSDNTASGGFNPKDDSATGTYSKSEVSNGIDRNVSLTSIVVGGESNNFILPVSDARIPTQVTGLANMNNASVGDYMVASGSAVVTLYDKTDVVAWDPIFQFKDQYGKELDAYKAAAFFKYAKNNNFGSTDKGIYGLRVDGASKGVIVSKNKDSDGISTKEFETAKVTPATSPTDNMIIRAGDSIKIEGALTDSDSKSNAEVVKFTVVKVDKDKVETGNKRGDGVPYAEQWNDYGKGLSKTITAVAVTEVKNLAISGLDKKLRVGVASGDAINVYNPGEESIKKNGEVGKQLKVDNLKKTDNNSVAYAKVVGKYHGFEVAVPSTYFEKVATASGSMFTTVPADDWGVRLDEIDLRNVKEEKLFDLGTFGYPAKDATFDFSIAVKKGSDVDTVTKSVKVSVAPRTVASLKFNAGGTLNPDDKFVGTSALTGGKDKLWADTNGSHVNKVAFWCDGASWAHEGVPAFETVDNYGNFISGTDGKFEVVYTISDYVENEGDFAHVYGNATIYKNGSKDVYVEGAELGDTYKLTATVKGTTISDSCTVKVGADKRAKVSSDSTLSTDEDFRKSLGYAK